VTPGRNGQRMRMRILVLAMGFAMNRRSFASILGVIAISGLALALLLPTTLTCGQETFPMQIRATWAACC